MELLGFCLILLAIVIMNGARIVKTFDGATPITAFLDKIDSKVYLFVALLVGGVGIALSLGHITLGW
jgi:hypothetical protein